MLWLGHNYYCVYIVFRCHMTHLWCDNINKMQNKLVFLAVLTSFGLVLDWFFEKPVATTLDRSLSGPGTIPRLPKAVQSSFLPKKAKKPDWTRLLNSMCEAEGEDIIGGKNHDEQESKVSLVMGYWFLGGSRRWKFELLSSWRCILLWGSLWREASLLVKGLFLLASCYMCSNNAHRFWNLYAEMYWNCPSHKPWVGVTRV